MVSAAADRAGQALVHRPPVPREATGLVFVGRGSSDPDANGNAAKLARMVGEGLRLPWSQAGFFDVALPRLETALEIAGRVGFSRIVALPYVLFPGVLMDRFQTAVAAARGRFPKVDFAAAGCLGDHPLVVETFVARAREMAAGPVFMNCLTCKYRAPLPGYEGEVGAPRPHHHHHEDEGEGR
jgi:sirohydrochlorin cobaltochelatase